MSLFAFVYAVYTLLRLKTHQKQIRWIAFLLFITSGLYVLHAAIEAFSFSESFYFFTGALGTASVFLVIMVILYAIKGLKE